MASTAETAWKVRRHFVVEREHKALSRLAGRPVTRREVEGLMEEAADAVARAAAAWDDNAFDFLEVPRSNATRYARDRAMRTTRARTVLLYIAIRLLGPTRVIETGCFTGWDSLLILSALDRNRHGLLHTIDLPARTGVFSQFGAKQGLPEGSQPGFLVPETLRSRWHFQLADVRIALPILLKDLDRVDVFFHDSHHSYEHMSWEFRTAWPSLSGGGLVVSDDIGWNTAFWDFARAVELRPAIVPGHANFGALQKGSS